MRFAVKILIITLLPLTLLANSGVKPRSHEKSSSVKRQSLRKPNNTQSSKTKQTPKKTIKYRTPLKVDPSKPVYYEPKRISYLSGKRLCLKKNSKLKGKKLKSCIRQMRGLNK